MGFVNDIEPLVNGLAILLSKGAEVQGDVLSSLIGALGGNIASIKFMGMKSKAEKAGVPKEYFSQIAVMMGNAGIAGFNTASKKYNSDSKPMPNDFEKTMNEVENCIMLLDMANDASDDDDDDDIKRYNSMIKMEEYCINMTAYADYSSYSRDWMLTDESKKTRRERISRYRDKIKEIEKAAREKAEEEARKAEEEKQARIAAYWEAHADEKAALDSELKELNDKKAAFEKEISDIESQIKAAEPTGKVPSEVEKDKIKDQISDLNNRRAKLGLFAGKEKKQIGEEIASLEGRLSALEGKIEEEKKARKAEADQKCAPLKAKKEELTGQKDAAVKRITAINKELTKDPEE